MIVRRVTEPLIAQCAYFVACPRTRQALLIDPVRDVARYELIATEIGVTIMAVVETHSPSDYVSGVREFLVSTASNAYLSGETTPPRWYVLDGGVWAPRVKFLKGGDQFSVGDLQCTTILTPGHALGGISVLIAHPPSGVRVLLTGDALLPGGAGSADTDASDAMRDSLQRLGQFDDDTVVLAGHTSGTSCGLAISFPGETTLGIERSVNRIFRSADDAAAFAATSRECAPDRPSYFSKMERVNQSERAQLLQELTNPKEIDGDTFVQLLSIPRTIVLDTRSWIEFVSDAPEGALHVPLDRYFSPLIAASIAPDERIVILCGRKHVAEIVRALRIVGMDKVEGWIDRDVFAKIDRSLLNYSEVDDISQHAAHEKFMRGEVFFLDVRNTAEWLRGRIAGATLMTLSQIPHRIGEIPKGKFIVAYCALGGRSARACAYLHRRGFECATLKGGYWPWYGRDYPVEAADRTAALRPDPPAIAPAV